MQVSVHAYLHVSCALQNKFDMLAASGNIHQAEWTKNTIRKPNYISKIY